MLPMPKSKLAVRNGETQTGYLTAFQAEGSAHAKSYQQESSSRAFRERMTEVSQDHQCLFEQERTKAGPTDME